MPELQIGSVFAGHRIDAVAGRGGMGVLYRATHLALEREVALKVIAADLADSEDFRERFKRESRTAASIQHPNVIPIFHAGEEDGVLYITMQFIEGTDLRQTISAYGALPPGDAAELTAQVAAGLDAAHKRGLVHRDVKPANILIANEGGRNRAFLTDFGLTKQASSRDGLTKTGMYVGTLDYISPEQLRGTGVDARADVYALGCVLYQALTGAVPYPRESEPAKMWAHMGEDPPVVSQARPSVPAPFDEVVRRSMAKEPDDRYPSAGDLGRAAKAAAEDQRVSDERERQVATGMAAPGATAHGAPTTPGDAPGGAATVTGAPPPGGIDLDKGAATTPGPRPAPTGPGGYAQPSGPGGPPATGPGPYPPPPAAPTGPGGPYPPQPSGGPGAGGTPPPSPGPAGAPAAKRKSKRPLLIGLGVLVAILVIAGVAVAALSGGDDGGSDGGAAGTVVGSPAQLQTEPTQIVASDDAIFLANGTAGTVTEVDAAANTIRKNIKVTVDGGGNPVPSAIAYEPVSSTLWVDAFTDTVVRYDAANDRQAAEVTVPSEAELRPMAADETAMWLLYPKKGELIKVDAKTNEVSDPITVGTASGNGRAISVAAGDGFAYVLRFNGEVVFVNGATDELVSGTPTKVGEQGGGIGYIDGTLYASTLVDGKDAVVRINAQSGLVSDPFPLGKFSSFDVASGSLWASYPLDAQVKRYDVQDRREVGTPVKLDVPPQKIAASGAGVFVVSEGNRPTLTKIEPSG